tara:strand:- start:519 stop:713 length:195 start_codon:yes stop_codon:yes gene_type:complete
MTIIIIVKITNKILVFKLKFDEEKTLGIIIKIIKGLTIPPDKYIKVPNCKISINRKINADLSDN